MALQFLNSLYKFPKYDITQNGKKIMSKRDVLIYTIKDIETSESTLQVIPSPNIDFYFSKIDQKFHKFSIPKEEATKITCKFNDRNKEIAKIVNMEQEYYNSFRLNNNREFMNKLRTHPYLYMTDVNIEDYYKTCFILREGDNYGKLKKGFADIEVDISKYVGFPDSEVAPCPINLITYIDGFNKKIYSFILLTEETRNQIFKIYDNKEIFIKTLPDEIKNNFVLEFLYFEEELQLIRKFFEVIHETKPDFLGFWNIYFDAKTIINRLRLTYLLPHDEIANIMCHPEVPKEFRYYKYIEDQDRKTQTFINAEGQEEKIENQTHPSRYWDCIEIPGYTQFYDQMSLFSNLRKRDILSSYKLDDIGFEYAGVNKVNLQQYGYSIKDVNIKNFEVFLRYNIQDAFVQYKIEEAQEDLDKYLVFSGNTRFLKGISVSTTIKNMIMMYLFNNNEIIGNSVYYDIEEKLEGAIVADPKYINSLGIPILGKPSYVFSNCIDLDLSSLYPSIMISENITKSALYGRITEVKKSNGDFISTGNDILPYIETIDTGIFELASSYLNLPSPDIILKNIEKNLINYSKK